MRNGPSINDPSFAQAGIIQPSGGAAAPGSPMRLTCKVEVPNAMGDGAAAPTGEDGSSDAQRIVVKLTIDGGTAGLPYAAPVATYSAEAVSVPGVSAAGYPVQAPGYQPAYPQVQQNPYAPAFAVPAVNHAVRQPVDYAASYPTGPIPVVTPVPRVNLADSVPPVFPHGETPAPATQPPASSPSANPATVAEPEFFDQRHSMVEGLLEADREHTRRVNRLRTSLIVIAAILALLLCAIALIGLAVDRGLLDLPNLPFAGQQDEGEGVGGNGTGTGNSDAVSKPSVTTPQQGGALEGEGGEDEGREGESPGLSGSAQAQDLSGTVRYSYSITASEGGKAQVTETVSFGKRGYAETSSMRLVFADEEAAKAFMERVERSYGTTYLGGTRTGAVAEVRIDVADGRLDRAAYKQALSETAQGLTVSEESKGSNGKSGTQGANATADAQGSSENANGQDASPATGTQGESAQKNTLDGSKQPSAE